MTGRRPPPRRKTRPCGLLLPVSRARQVATRVHTRKDRGTIAVSVEEDVSNGADRITRAGAATRGDRVHADKDYVELGRRHISVRLPGPGTLHEVLHFS